MIAISQTYCFYLKINLTWRTHPWDVWMDGLIAIVRMIDPWQWRQDAKITREQSAWHLECFCFSKKMCEKITKNMNFHAKFASLSLNIRKFIVFSIFMEKPWKYHEFSRSFVKFSCLYLSGGPTKEKIINASLCRVFLHVFDWSWKGLTQGLHVLVLKGLSLWPCMGFQMWKRFNFTCAANVAAEGTDSGQRHHWKNDNECLHKLNGNCFHLFSFGCKNGGSLKFVHFLSTKEFFMIACCKG